MTNMKDKHAEPRHCTEVLKAPMSEHITDAMVETARQADYLHDPERMECLNHDGSCCPAFDHNVGDERTHRVRAALEAVAPAIAAKALRDFASASNTSEFHIEVLLGGSDYVRHVLRTYADHVERGES